MTDNTDPRRVGTAPDPHPPGATPGLRRGTINSRHLVFFVIAAAAPLTILVDSRHWV